MKKGPREKISASGRSFGSPAAFGSPERCHQNCQYKFCYHNHSGAVFQYPVRRLRVNRLKKQGPKPARGETDNGCCFAVIERVSKNANRLHFDFAIDRNGGSLFGGECRPS
jgi:hypothetical protein